MDEEKKLTKEEEIKKEREDNIAELNAKKDELKKSEERLVSLPKDIKATKSKYEDDLAQMRVRKKYLALWATDLHPMKVKYEVEASAEWKEIRKEDLAIETRRLERNIKQIEMVLADGIKTLNAQESRIKESIPKLKKRITELKDALK